MQRKILQLFAIAATLFLFTPAFAQNVVRGTVKDAKTGEPLIGVTVTYKEGIKIISGASTDINGKYELQAGTTGLIDFSYVGYIPLEKPVSQVTSGMLDIALGQDIANLSEVVVTGLATTVKRSNLGNDIKTLDSREITGVSIPQTFDQALTGKVPGSNILSNSGAPGGGINVRFRGVTSIFGNSQPLWVVDGVILNNSATAAGLNTVTAAQAGGAASNQDNPSNRIADLNPDDVASVEVLPGASAAAIYGAQAAAGVVVITTKKGSPNEPRINFTQDFGVIAPRKLLGVRQFTDSTAKETYGQTGLDLFQQAEQTGNFYDYEKELFGNTGISSHSYLSFSGGTDKSTYYISGSYRHDDGIVTNTGYRAYSVRANLEQKLSKSITFDYSGWYTSTSADRGLTNNDNKGVTLGIALTASPEFVELHPTNGVYPDNPLGASNPLQTAALSTNNEAVYRTTQAGNIKVNIFQDNKQYLNLSAYGGLDYYNLKTTAIFPNSLQFESNGNGTGGASLQGFNNSLSFNIGTFLTYYYNVHDKIDFTTSVGFTENDIRFDGILNTATQLIGDQTNVNQAGALTAVQNRSRSRIEGFFGQEEINYSDVLIATGSIRLDRSSDVGEYLKYVPYPKVSLAWNLNKMFANASNNIDNIKLRAAYGESGNYPPYGTRNTTMVPSNIGGLAGSVVGNQQFGTTVEGNPDIKSERQKEFEAGLDLSFFKERLSFTGSYYVKKDADLLLQAATPPSSGFQFQWINGGTLQNKGVELTLGVVPIDKPNISWSSNISFWLNRSRVETLSVPAFPPPSGGFGTTLASFFIEQGKSATQIIGISPTSNPENPDPNRQDTIWGNAEPKFTMSFDESVTFLKNFSFEIIGFWKDDFQVINLSQLLFDLDGTSPDYDAHTLKDPLLNPDGTLSNAQVRIAALGVTSKYFVQQAGYFRFAQIGLYYNIPLHGTSQTVKAVKVGISANNFFTITNYTSYDPEVNNFGTNGIATGIEVTPYPSSRQIYGHVSVTF